MVEVVVVVMGGWGGRGGGGCGDGGGEWLLSSLSGLHPLGSRFFWSFLLRCEEEEVIPLGRCKEKKK